MASEAEGTLHCCSGRKSTPRMNRQTQAAGRIPVESIVAMGADSNTSCMGSSWSSPWVVAVAMAAT